MESGEEGIEKKDSMKFVGCNFYLDMATRSPSLYIVSCTRQLFHFTSPQKPQHIVVVSFSYGMRILFYFIFLLFDFIFK